MKSSDYYLATRHLLPVFILLLPLLTAYEGGVLLLGGPKPDAMRNGADAWLRWALQSFGLDPMIVAPLLVGVVFAGWAWMRQHDRPSGLWTICSGMTLECFVAALGLWGLSYGFAPFLDYVGVPLSNQPAWKPLVGRIITFVGAGIYEEILFRLILFSGLAWLLKLAQLPKLSAIALASLASALLFAAAHHVGPYGEKMDSYVFLFRMMAGVYFALIYHFRGFGIAAGAHACYDVLVGLT